MMNKKKLTDFQIKQISKVLNNRRKTILSY